MHVFNLTDSIQQCEKELKKVEQFQEDVHRELIPRKELGVIHTGRSLYVECVKKHIRLIEQMWDYQEQKGERL